MREATLIHRGGSQRQFVAKGVAEWKVRTQLDPPFRQIGLREHLQETMGFTPSIFI